MSFGGLISDAFHHIEHAGDSALHGRFGDSLGDLAAAGKDLERLGDEALHELEHLEASLEEFGGKLLSEVDHFASDAFHEAEAGLVGAMDAVANDVTELAATGAGLISEGVSMVGAAVMDFAEAAEQGLEDVAHDIEKGVTDAASWLAEQATHAVDEFGHTVEAMALEAKKGFEKFADELKHIADKLLSFFKDFANIKKAFTIKNVLDQLLDYGFEQALRAFSGLLELGPSMLEYGPQIPFMKAARVQLESQQSMVNGIVGGANKLLDKLGGHGGMSLVNTFMDAATSIMDAATETLNQELHAVGLGELGDAIVGLEHCFDPLLMELHNVFGSGELKLNLHDLLTAIFGTLTKLAEWIRANVTDALDLVAQRLVLSFKRTLKTPQYIPGLSELWWGFATWWNLNNSGSIPTKLSIFDGITLALAYFIHVFYRVATGKMLEIDPDEVKRMLASLPRVPDKEAVKHFFQAWVSDGLSESTLKVLFEPTSGASTKMLGAALSISYKIPPALKGALSAIFALVDMVAVTIATPGELVLNMVSAILKGTTGALRGLLQGVALLGGQATMSAKRIGLEITTMVFKLFMLPRQLLVGVLASQELSIVSTIPGAAIKLIEVLIMLADKGAAIALASVKYDEKASTSEGMHFAITDASLKIAATLVGAVPPLVKLLSDPAISAQLSALLASVTEGIGGVEGVASQAARLVVLLRPAVPIIEIGRLTTDFNHQVSSMGAAAA